MEKYDSNIKLGTVTLNVVNLEKQIKFLQNQWEWN